MKASFDIDALRAVVTGVDQGSFARAANELGRSQSAVSMQLKKLEQQAGVDLFVRKGRGLAPTEAGAALIDYARRIIALNDEAARAVGAAAEPETIRLGLPQDFFDDVMPAAAAAFAERHPDAHVAVRAGNNHTIAEDVEAGRLDAAVAFFLRGETTRGALIRALPLRWRARLGYAPPAAQPLPLVLFNHPCLFRRSGLAALDQAGLRWRAALTTPSLSAVWAALRSGFGVGVRVDHATPQDIGDVEGLPPLEPVELRLLIGRAPSPLVQDMASVLRAEVVRALDQSVRETP